MAKLIYSAITSLDGYVADEDGNFDWAAPSEPVHAFVNDMQRPIGTYLLGRRMYEVMLAWETMDPTNAPPVIADFIAIWRSAEKVVFSRSLEAASSERTRIEREFDADAVRQWKASATTDLGIGGPELAAIALRAGLVDECHLFVNPIVVGAGTPALPDRLRLQLDLLDEHRFDNGVIHLHYRIE